MRATKLLIAFLICLLSPSLHSQTKEQMKEVNRLLEYIGKQSNAWHSKKSSHSDDVFLTQMHTLDTRHQQQVDSLFLIYGWLKPPMVSKKASRAYFDVIQRAPVKYQEKYQNEVFQATQHQVVNPSEYYLYIDYIRTQQNKYQIFGTQGKSDDLGNFYFIPVDTTLIHNRKLPILPPGEYIYFSNPKWITIFVHVSNSASKPVSNVQIYTGGNLVGQTNSQGFAQILLPQFTASKEFVLRKGKGVYKHQLPNTNRADWLDLFIIFEPTK